MNCSTEDIDPGIEHLPYAYARHRIETNSAGDAVDYTFLAVNSAFEQMTGLAREAIIGRRVTEVLPGIDSGGFNWIKHYAQVASGRLSLRFEEYSQPLRRWYEVKAYSDQLGYFVTVFNDITVRKGAEQVRQDKEEKLKLILSASRAMVAAKEPRRLSEIAVETITKLTQMQSAAVYVLRDGFLSLDAANPPLPPDFPESARRADLAGHRHIGRALTSKKPVILSDTRVTKLTAADQEIVDMLGLRSILYIPLLHMQEPIGVLIAGSIDELHTFSDDEIGLGESLASQAAIAIIETRLSAQQNEVIADMKKKNEQLRQAETVARRNEQRVVDILRYAENLAFVTTDSNWENPRILDFSPGAERMFGYQKSEVIGRSVAILHIPEDVERFPELGEAMRQGKTGFFGESTLVRKGGRRFPALFKTHPLFDDRGEMWGTIGVSFDITERKQAEEKLARTLSAYKKSLHGIVRAVGRMMGKRDHYTAEHQKRVAGLAVAIAERLGFESEQIEGLRLAAEIHDVGKIVVPAEILTKPGELSDLEYQLICTHSQAGFDILRDIDFPWPIAENVKQHHERLDGSGYPHGLSGSEILREAKIISVADVVESMASHRPYRPALGLDRALEEITANSGILYDSEAAAACLDLFRNQKPPYQLEK